MNYGINRLRFISPVKTGSRVREPSVVLEWLALTFV